MLSTAEAQLEKGTSWSRFSGLRLNARTIFVIKLIAQTLFGIVVLFDSLYLILNYVSNDFFGFLNSPFFGWIQRLSRVSSILYFPALLAAILSIEAGGDKQRSQKLAGIFICLQVLAGMVLLYPARLRSLIGWPMLFGPNVRAPLGDVYTYADAMVCLLPLLWMSVVRFAASTPEKEEKIHPSENRLPLRSFIAAGLTASALFSAFAIRQQLPFSRSMLVIILALDLAAHLTVFTAIFLIFQWGRVISSRFAHPGRLQFMPGTLAAGFLLAVVIRRVVFSALAFNNHLADYYACAFSFTAVLYFASLITRIKSSHEISSRQIEAILRSRISGGCALLAALALFYETGVKLAPIDWQHILGNLTALGVWALLLWGFHCFMHRPVTYRAVPLSLLSLAVLAGFAAMGVTGESGMKATVADAFEQYANYDASFFALREFAKPVVHDEQYAESYDFLSRHAGIRIPVPAPQVSLTTEVLRAGSSDKPHIFMFVIDALRRDYLSAYNSAVDFTPAIQAFANESVVFQNAYTPYGGTALAEPAIWSGFQQLHKIYPQPLSNENSLQRMLNIDNYHSYVSYDTVLADLVPQTPNLTVLSSGMTNWQQKEFSAVIAELEDKILRRTDPERPVFAYSQPANVHTLSLTLYSQQVVVLPHPGFDDKYASAVAQVDQTFGGFIAFLKKQGIYDNSIVILTSDHGESLGEGGRHGHVANITPEVLQIPLIMHIPERMKSKLVWNAQRVVSLHDLTPTLYYLLGHSPIRKGEMLGRPLFTRTLAEQDDQQPADHYFFMSSYTPVFGVLSGDRQSLFIVDASLKRNYFYNLKDDPHALRNRITVSLRDRYEPLIRQELEEIDRFYGVKESDLNH